MSRWGCFYELSDAAKTSFAGLNSKSEWYDALGQWKLESAPQLDAEQSLQYGWIWALRDQPYPLGKLFSGDLHTNPDGTGDPEVVFLGAQLVQSLARELAENDKAFFLELLSADEKFRADRSAYISLLEPIRSFFAAAASRGQAVIVMWGD